MQYHEVKVNIDFESKANCIKHGQTGPTSDLEDVSLWVDYIFLDTDERENRLRSKVTCQKKLGSSFGKPFVPQKTCTVASLGLFQYNPEQNTLLFGNPLRALSTNG